MANTYTQCYIHLVFAPKNREALIGKAWRLDLEKYMTGIIKKKNHKLLAIAAQPDHVHVLIGYNINDRIPDLIEDIKTSTNAWIKQNKLSPFKFEWQKGYGAFTHSRAQIDAVVNYILNQETHHAKRPFREEYMDILSKNGVDYDAQYLFDFF